MDDLVLDEKIRLDIFETRKNIEVLQKHHQQLCAKANSGNITDDEIKLLREIVMALQNLQKKLKELSPSLIDIALRISKKNQGG